ncbi:MAG: DUF4321 domain-containing protein [Clostridia bacterium]|nr:DUF4321 domain-containing protein [Clostridia bacterium]
MATREKNTLVFIVFILCGIVIGGLLGEVSKSISWLSWLSYGQSFGFSDPFTLDLGVMQLTLGLMIKINVASIIGIIVSIFIYRKV